MNIKNSIKVVIADTQFLIVESLISVLSSSEKILVVGIAGSKKELLEILLKIESTVIIIDPLQLDFTGLDDFKIIKQNFPRIPILILAQAVTKTEFVELRKLEINNIIFKTTGKDELFAAIEATVKGKKFFTPDLLDLIVDNSDGVPLDEESRNLTHSEIEIVRLITNGYTTKEIASKRNISFHTVNTHRKNIFRKLGVNSTSELIMQAIKSGWIDNIEYYI